MRTVAAVAAAVLLAGCQSVPSGDFEIDSLGQKLAVGWGVKPESVPPIIDELSRHIDLRSYLECMVREREEPRPDMAACRRWLGLGDGAVDMPEGFDPWMPPAWFDDCYRTTRTNAATGLRTTGMWCPFEDSS